MKRKIQLLGNLAIQDDGQTAVLQSSAKGSALLVYLMVRGQTETREHVADLLWDADSTAAALRNLRVLLTRIRSALPDVAVSRKELRFVPLKGEHVDYCDLVAALAKKDIETLPAKLQLYQGDLLTGFYLDDAPRFQEWLTVERERLRRAVLDAHRWLCQHLAAQEQWAQGVETAVHWLNVDDLDEEALRWLMQFRVAQGQTATALDDYEQFRSRLQETLDVAPAAKTRQLAQELREAYGEAANELFTGVDFKTQITWPASNSLAPVGLLTSTALVPFRRNANFIGREDVLLQLADLLLPWPDKEAAATPPVAVLNGMGGLGKTQTAVEFCYRYGRYFPGGVFWLSFASADNVAEEIAHSGGEHGLGLFQESERLTLAEQVGRVRKVWQEPIPRLLIFDNCEDENLLADWLPVTGGCRVLATSRRGVWSSELGATNIPLNLLSADESSTLLQQLIPHIHPNEAKAIATEVGHLPLALYLVGGFLNRYRQISPGHYLAQLQNDNLLDHPSLQGRGTSYSPTGHELNVARTCALSYEQFDPDDPVDALAQSLLDSIACFAPGEPVEWTLVQATIAQNEQDIEAILMAGDGLNRLIALGFLQVEAEDMVVMHRLLVAYTRSVMGDACQAIQRVEESIVQALTAIWEKNVDLGDLPFALRQLRYVTDRALQRQDLMAANLANYLGRHLTDVKKHEQAEPYLTQALQIRQTLLGEHIETAASLTNMGTMLWRQDADRKAMPYFEEAAQMYHQLLGPDHPRTARGFNNLAVLYKRQGQFETAETYYEKALAIYKRAEAMDDPMVPLILTNAGKLLMNRGQYEKAYCYYEQAHQLRVAISGAESFRTTAVLYSWARLLLYMGHYEKAQRYAERVLDVRQKLRGNEAAITITPYITLGELHIIAERFAEAQAHLERSLSLLEKHQPTNHLNLAQAFTQLGQLKRQQGALAEAEAFFKRACHMFEKLQMQHYEKVETLNHLADLYLQIGQLELAKDVLAEAWANCMDVLGEQHPLTAQTQLRWGEWHQLQGNEEEARPIFEEVARVLKTAVAPTHINYIRVQKCLAAL